MDRHGVPIANNRTDFRVDIIPDRLEDKGRTLGLLREILNLPADIYPSGSVASVSGLSGTGAGVGTIVATYLTGLVADRYSFRPVLITASVIPLVAAAAILILASRDVGRPKVAERCIARLIRVGPDPGSGPTHRILMQFGALTIYYGDRSRRRR